MKNKKNILLVIFGIFLIGIVSATYCCERTTTNAWCQNVAEESMCNLTYQSTSAYCEATSYCKTGTCMNPIEGTCIASTEVVCTNEGGTWSERSKDELPQCQRGCCIQGENAMFITQTECNARYSRYGVVVEFFSNINDQLTCLAKANPSDEGACVYTENYQTRCNMTTRKECQSYYGDSSELTEIPFYEGMLCSAPELETICTKSDKTVCGEDGRVYFTDSCGNLANVYDSDSSKFGVDMYWTYIQEPSCSEGANKNSASCGDCSYLEGSFCGEKGTNSVDYGDYICRDLDCVDYRGPYSRSSSGDATETIYPRHGESWCTTDEDWTAPGGTSFVLSCFYGEVNAPSECDETRSTVCKESVLNEETGFTTAKCAANRWGDCAIQNTSETCLDKEERDCEWITGSDWNDYYFTFDGRGMINTKTSSSPDGICVPEYAPAADLSSETADAGMCGLANAICYVTMERHWTGLGEWVCDDLTWGNNCSCLNYKWEEGLNEICTKLGDCGMKDNYLGEPGYHNTLISIIEGGNKSEEE